jgi:hypothetical protein
VQISELSSAQYSSISRPSCFLHVLVAFAAFFFLVSGIATCFYKTTEVECTDTKHSVHIAASHLSHTTAAWFFAQFSHITINDDAEGAAAAAAVTGGMIDSERGPIAPHDGHLIAISPFASDAEDVSKSDPNEAKYSAHGAQSTSPHRRAAAAPLETVQSQKQQRSDTFATAEAPVVVITVVSRALVLGQLNACDKSSSVDFETFTRRKVHSLQVVQLPRKCRFTGKRRSVNMGNVQTTAATAHSTMEVWMVVGTVAMLTISVKFTVVELATLVGTLREAAHSDSSSVQRRVVAG